MEARIRKSKKGGWKRRARRLLFSLGAVVYFSVLLSGFLGAVIAPPNVMSRNAADYHLVGNPILEQGSIRIDTHFGLRIDETDPILAYWTVNLSPPPDPPSTGSVMQAMIDMSPVHDPDNLTAWVYSKNGVVDVDIHKEVNVFGIRWTLEFKKDGSSANGIGPGEGVGIAFTNGTAFSPDDFRITDQRDFCFNGNHGANCSVLPLSMTEWGNGDAPPIPPAPVPIDKVFVVSDQNTVAEQSVPTYGQILSTQLATGTVAGSPSIDVRKTETFTNVVSNMNTVGLLADFSSGMLAELKTYLATHDPNQTLYFSITIGGTESNLLDLGSQWDYAFSGDRLYAYLVPDYLESIGGIQLGVDYSYLFQIKNPADIFSNYSGPSGVISAVGGNEGEVKKVPVPELPVHAWIYIPLFVLGAILFSRAFRRVKD